MKSFDEIIAAARKIGPKRLAVAGPADGELQDALDLAAKEGLARGAIFDTAPAAVAAVKNGDADVLMKGNIDTQAFMQAILDRDRGLRGGTLLSHIAVVEVLSRLFLITDGGIVLNPTLEEKAQIILNAVPIANALGIETPKVAVLAAVEKENPKMPETADAAALARMNLPGCLVQGPLAVDNAVSPEAAAAKGVSGPVAGHADILLVPSVLVGNIFAKGIMYFAACRFGGVVAGTTQPVIFLSRADKMRTKLDTMALGVLLSEIHTHA
jgi:phosphate butyryltransferase